ncbi:hypothetical protein [Streptomyces sp. IBSBF 2806]|uniref:hypothetical protein n=1 Tax=Streptomyces sp. IBSBF 2806 TaxID=2903529 RepID=UPI002FDBD0BB
MSDDSALGPATSPSGLPGSRADRGPSAGKQLSPGTARRTIAARPAGTRAIEAPHVVERTDAVLIACHCYGGHDDGTPGPGVNLLNRSSGRPVAH